MANKLPQRPQSEKQPHQSYLKLNTFYTVFDFISMHQVTQFLIRDTPKQCKMWELLLIHVFH